MFSIRPADNLYEMTIADCESPALIKPIPWDRFLANSKIPQGQTDELLTWISKVNQKKNAVRGRKERDLRKEVLLESARQAAQKALRDLQQERMEKWKMLKVSKQLKTEVDNSCDCLTCILCKRYQRQTYGKCYCNVIFRPMPMSLDCISNEDEDSMSVDKFLASLSSNVKRKPEDDLSNARKRCKA